MILPPPTSGKKSADAHVWVPYQYGCPVEEGVDEGHRDALKSTENAAKSKASEDAQRCENDLKKMFHFCQRLQ